MAEAGDKGALASLALMDNPNQFLSTVQVGITSIGAVSYTHLRAHETVLDLVCRLLLEKKTPCRSYGPILPTTDTR